MNPNKRPPPSSSGGASEGGDGLVQRDATKRARDVPDGKILRPGQEQPGNVLLVRVTDIVHPVTVLALQQIFSRFGKVNKIVMFDKGSGFQALVQMEDVYSAMNAHEAADMQEMYSGCNLIRVGYSNLQNVTVKTNSERSWDFNIGPPLEGALPPGTSVSPHSGSPGIPAPVAAAGHAKSPSSTSHQAASHQGYSTQQYSPYSAVQQHKQHSYTSPPQQQQHMYTPPQQPYGTPPHSGYPSPQHQPPYNNGAVAAGGSPYGQPVPGAANSAVATVNGSYVSPLAYGQQPYVPPYAQASPAYPQQSYLSQQSFAQNYPHMTPPHGPGDDSSGNSGGAGMGISGTSGAGAGNYSRASPPQPQHNPGGGYYPPSSKVMPAGGPYGSIPYSSERGPGGFGSMSGMGMGRPNYLGRQGGGGGGLGGGGLGGGSGASHGGRAPGYGGGGGSRGSTGGGLLQPPIHRPLASLDYDNGHGYASRPPVRYRSQDRKSSGAASGGGAIKSRSRVPLLDPRHIQALTPTAAATGKKSARRREPDEEGGRERGSSSGRVGGGGAAGGGTGLRSGLMINFVKEKGAQDSVGRKKEATVVVEGKEGEGGGVSTKKVRASGSQKRANKREAAEMLGPDTADQLAAATAKVRVSDHQSPAADGSEAGADGESKRVNKREAAEMLGADAADQLAAATAKVRVSDDVEEEAEAKAAAGEGEGDANEPDSGDKATTDRAALIGGAQTTTSSVDATAVVPNDAGESTLGVVVEEEGEKDEDEKRGANPAAATATTQDAAVVLKCGASDDDVGNGASLPGEAEGAKAIEINGIGKSVEVGRRTSGAAVAEVVDIQDTDNKPAEGGKRASQGRRKGRWNTAGETADGDRERRGKGVNSIETAESAAKSTVLDEGKKDGEIAQLEPQNTSNVDDTKSNTANEYGLPGGAKISERGGNGVASGGSSSSGEPVEEEGGTTEGLTEEEIVDGDEAEGEAKARSQEDEDDAAGDEAEAERVDVGAWAAAAPGERSPILMVLRVDGHEVSPGALCQLFGLYGDVMKVKLVPSRGMALVQMRYAVQAINAQRLLDQTPLCGMILEVKASSQWTINDPTATDFSEYQGVHRYETVPSPEDSRYRDGLSPPCSTLVIDNVSPDVSAEEITSIFTKHGVVSSVDLDTHAEAPTGTAPGNTAPKPSVQALVHMEADGRIGATEAAVHALVMTHNLTLRERRLRVSFLSGDRHVGK